MVEVKVIKEGMVQVENRAWCLMLDGEREVRELIKKLTNALFEIHSLDKEGG